MLLSRTSTCIGLAPAACIGRAWTRDHPAHALGVTLSNVGAQIGRCRWWARVLPMAITESHGTSYMGIGGPNSQGFLKTLARHSFRERGGPLHPGAPLR